MCEEGFDKIEVKGPWELFFLNTENVIVGHYFWNNVNKDISVNYTAWCQQDIFLINLTSAKSIVEYQLNNVDLQIS